MTLVLIGAGGFLGSHLAAHLAGRGEAVLPLSYRPERHRAFLDAFLDMIRAGPPSAVLYAGGSQNGRDDAVALEELSLSNVVLPAAIAALLRDHAPECCLVTYGTSWQTGEQGVEEPFNAYAASKTAAEAFLRHFALDGVRSATLRLYDTYGPGDRRNKVVNLIADAIARRSDLAMSSGGQVIELVHVRDVLAATDATLAELRQGPPGRHLVYAVRSGQPLRILDVLATMLRVAGLEKAEFIRPGVYPYRRRERFALFPDTPTPPGWRPVVPLEAGLRELIEERRRIAGAAGAPRASDPAAMG
ncbi:NAD-dependent epimerase/dehydratase family protein [Neoroseomonas soli]|uniref:NAD(P)-dependent oxidoreductase n=1 Tax=Neoroseomonas soli TaxID=1081025 RepID=A0A9X9X0T8_9PROT|nr:NAD(P)-dependent oxidoreductase [Neoroseomonas soli]